ncbi:MAG: orotate phosphoribosyltransferase [Candidatus Desulforudis sp.]|nr:orotate phosphoribosyltransferase [Desulforudis sp.]
MTSSGAGVEGGPTGEFLTTEDHQTLHRLLLTRAFQFGEFVLSSGKKSTYYFDGKQVTLDPGGAYLVARAVLDKVKGKGVQAVGGPVIGADPIVGAVAVVCALQGLNMGLFIVRKDAKRYGKRRRIEGPPLQPGTRVAVVDDVLTTGGSILEAVEAVQEAGCVVVKAVVLVDRREGGTELLESKAIPVDPIFTIEDFKV